MLEAKTVNKIKSYVTEQLANSWKEKKHDLTGNLVDSIEYKIGADFIDVYMNDYGAIQDRGVTAANIPYSQGSGRKTSKYIEGLMNYVDTRMGITKGSRENKAVAFAIAHSHKAKGMRLGDNGKGSKWITSIIDRITLGIGDIILQEEARKVEILILKSFK